MLQHSDPTPNFHCRQWVIVNAFHCIMLSIDSPSFLAVTLLSEANQVLIVNDISIKCEKQNLDLINGILTGSRWPGLKWVMLQLL